MREYLNFINGRDVASTGGGTITRVNPANQEPVANWPAGTAIDMAAAFADGRWSRLTGAQWSDVLRKVSEQLRNNGSALARTRRA